MYKILTITLVVYFFISLTTPFLVIGLDNYYLKPELFLNSLSSLSVVLTLIWLPNNKKTTFKLLLYTPILILIILISNLLIKGILKEQLYSLIYIISIIFVFTIIRFFFSENTRRVVETPIIMFIGGVLMVHIITPCFFLYTKFFYYPRIFDNYGQYSNYIALFFPFFISIFIFRTVESKLDYLIKLLSCILAFTVLLVLFFNNVRTAWLPALLFLFFCFFKDSILNLSKKYNNFSKAKKNKIIVFSILAFLSIFLFSYYLKKDSADGRLFIWEISWKIFLDYPLTGVGFNHFQSYYTIYQANYFKTHQDPQNAWLASDIFFAFNEILQSLVEFGVVAIVLWLAVFYEVKKILINICSNWYQCPSKQWLFAGYLGFLTILIFQIFFSYPFKDQSSTHTIFIFNLFYTLSILSK